MDHQPLQQPQFFVDHQPLQQPQFFEPPRSSACTAELAQQNTHFQTMETSALSDDFALSDSVEEWSRAEQQVLQAAAACEARMEARMAQMTRSGSTTSLSPCHLAIESRGSTATASGKSSESQEPEELQEEKDRRLEAEQKAAAKASRMAMIARLQAAEAAQRAPLTMAARAEMSKVKHALKREEFRTHQQQAEAKQHLRSMGSRRPQDDEVWKAGDAGACSPSPVRHPPRRDCKSASKVVSRQSHYGGNDGGNSENYGGRMQPPKQPPQRPSTASAVGRRASHSKSSASVSRPLVQMHVNASPSRPRGSPRGKANRSESSEGESSNDFWSRLKQKSRKSTTPPRRSHHAQVEQDSQVKSSTRPNSCASAARSAPSVDPMQDKCAQRPKIKMKFKGPKLMKKQEEAGAQSALSHAFNEYRVFVDKQVDEYDTLQDKQTGQHERLPPRQDSQGGDHKALTCSQTSQHNDEVDKPLRSQKLIKRPPLQKLLANTTAECLDQRLNKAATVKRPKKPSEAEGLRERQIRRNLPTSSSPLVRSLASISIPDILEGKLIHDDQWQVGSDDLRADLPRTPSTASRCSKDEVDDQSTLRGPCQPIRSPVCPGDGLAAHGAASSDIVRAQVAVLNVRAQDAEPPCNPLRLPEAQGSSRSQQVQPQSQRSSPPLQGEEQLLCRVLSLLQELAMIRTAGAVCREWAKVVDRAAMSATVINTPHLQDIERCEALRSVRLVRSKLSCSQVQILCAGLTGKSSLQVLHLDGVDMSDASARSLFGAALRSCMSLEDLTLVACNLQPPGASAIFEALRGRCGTNLRALRLPRNNLTGSANTFVVTDSLALLLRESPQLTELDLTSCSLTAAGAGPVLEALVLHKKVCDLNLTDNTAGSVVLTKVAKLLPVNGGSLRSLRIAGNGLSDHQVQSLVDLVQQRNDKQNFLLDH